jgi:CubicO group peptidase (beta-lactamase class C family)
MKTLFRSKLWIWVGAVLLVALLGVSAYIYLPGRGSLPSPATPDYWPTDGWKEDIAEHQGIDSAQLADGIRSMQEKQLAIDSLMIVRNGYVVLDAYFSSYDGSFPHDLASITKSVMTTLIGIAVDQGKLQLDQKVVSFFPDRSITNLDERKKNMTILDLVSMRNGMESECFNGDEPTLASMRSAPDWIQAALDRKMVYEPGTHFCYDSPGMHLLSAILQETTGMTALEYAQKYLFGPLGIRDVIWLADPQGYTYGWGDLHLKPEDAAKLGYLWINRGFWNGQQIVSDSWVSASVKAHSRMVGNEYGYGYGWWVTAIDFYAMGREGQYIHVLPSINTIVVITAGEDVIDQVMPFLLKVLVSSGKELPANPSGQAELAAAIAEISQGSDNHPSASLPEKASEISGQTFICEPNPAGVTIVRLDFNGPAEAGFSLRMNGQDIFWPVGLDGEYRMAADGQATLGFWEDEQTFVLNIFDIGQLTRNLTFNGSNLHVSIPEGQMNLECQIQTP